MQPDKNTVRQLLSLSDSELLSVIKKLCEENNVDPKFKIGPGEIAMLRTGLSRASDSDIEAFLKYFSGGKRNGR